MSINKSKLLSTMIKNWYKDNLQISINLEKYEKT